jgi:hypothetical protein
MFINGNMINDLLNEIEQIKITIITSWRIIDLLNGFSDIELYNYCKEKKIYLFLNDRIHLKTIIKDYNSCIFGSANITKKGLSLTDKYNYELAANINKLTDRDILYFKKILKESMLVNDIVYNYYKNELQKQMEIVPPKEIDISKIKPDPEFLISALPMTKNTDKLFYIYKSNLACDNHSDLLCAIHDVLLYEIPENLDKEEFNTHLKQKFFKSKFIIKLLEYIDDEKYFGNVKEWIQKNCTDVPVPSRRDLTGNIQVLYRWIVELGDGLYKVDIPGSHSERIFKVK